MRYTQLILSLFLFFSFVIALPVPAPVAGLEERASSKGGSSGKKNAKAEAKGIDKNIGIQKQEQKDVKGVKNAKNQKEFNKSKDKLVGTIKDGEKVRADNQKKADKSNKQLTDGLKKVQGAQAKEEKQAKGLKGNTSAADKKTIKKLNGEFKDGINQNEKNKNAALKGNKGSSKKGGKV